MTYFQNLNQIVESLETDETTKNDPIKRIFVSVNPTAELCLLAGYISR